MWGNSSLLVCKRVVATWMQENWSLKVTRSVPGTVCSGTSYTNCSSKDTLPTASWYKSYSEVESLPEFCGPAWWKLETNGSDLKLSGLSLQAFSTSVNFNLLQRAPVRIFRLILIGTYTKMRKCSLDYIWMKLYHFYRVCRYS